MFALGISSHAPLPFSREWCMKPEALDEYLLAMGKIKMPKSDLQIYTGLEIDFIPEKISPAHFQSRLDYTIGSIHFVDQLPNGEGWEIDGSHELFLTGLNDIFQGDVASAVKRYFELTREMIQKSPPNLIGHFDKIKMQNVDQKFFRESDPWYRAEVLQTLDLLAKTDCIMEVNTRGIYQKKTTTTYPSPWILTEALKRGIPITLSSDAHHPKDLTNHFREAAGLLNSLGFKKMRILLDEKWQDIAFDQNGLQHKRFSYYPMA
jgi:histidinol-phosphatase (PHP family)